ncbi:MAG: hypothetical protein II864_07300 [Prevotella sp.]|nr:hypothetical protein [Prevotella sp.]
MRKVYLLAAAAAVMLASCSSKDSLESAQTVSSKPLAEGEVGFDAYTQRSTTRAGQAGEMTLEKLKASKANGGGFGVFAYYTDNNDYDQQRIPDFMYNQPVLWNAGSTSWDYEPVKYWPNEYGQSAISDDNDKVSFFAYAPYVEVVPSSGKLNTSADEAKWGITGMSRNSASGDPLIKYIVSFDEDKSVDLMWGVCDNPQWSIIDTGSKQLINDGEKGKPWLNVCRPQTVDQRMMFTFKHALTQLSVNVDAYVDGYDNANALPNADGNRTRIFIRQISFTGFALKGALNLNNSEEADKAYWLDYNGNTDLESGESVVIYDGRKDGKEGASGSAASNEKTLGLNPQFVQDAEWNSGQMTAGVTNVPAPLFRKYNAATDSYVASSNPLMIIPTGEDIEVEIVYDVETADDNLSTYVSDKKQFGSSIENRIRKPIKFGDSNFESGKHYTINLHLGMNSVKFDAEVSDWLEADVETDVHLPSNMPTFQASTSATAAEYTSAVSVDYNKAEYIFAVAGLNGGESVAATTSLTGAVVAVNSKPDFSGNDGIADLSGVAYVRVTDITSNNDVLNVTTANAINVTGNASSARRVIDVTQLAHPLGLGAQSLSDDSKTITLSTTATLGSTDNWQIAGTDGTAAYIEVLKNGTALTQVSAAPADNSGEFQFNTTTLGINLGTAAAPGDVFTITVKTGDAYEETIQAKVGGISFANTNPSIVYGTAGFDNLRSSAGVTATYESSNDDVVTVDGSGVVTTLTAGSSTISATPTAAAGYILPTGTAPTYVLIVTKATGCTVTASNVTKKRSEVMAGIDLTTLFTIKNANGDALEIGNSATNKAGALNIGLTQSVAHHVNLDGNNLVKYHSSNASYQPTVGDVYTITATMDATDNLNVEYADGRNTVTFTITVVAD